MKDFEYRTRGKVSPAGRQRVYFTCCPDDFDAYFDEIAGIILKEYDCAIWFCREEPDDEREYAARIAEMRLFVIPITERFLAEPCRAREIDLPFALGHRIPVLLLMQGSGLDEPFARRCGDLHYIGRDACDMTTLSYEQKIGKFLSSVLIDDRTIQKIREAFYARIFLSYRKKDRAFANRLMGLIHDIPFCRDISIWFDEYLVSGYSFNRAIEEAMKSSRLFVLCITESLVDKDNYVQRVEYPMALSLSLPIVPVMLEKLTPGQMEALRQRFAGIPECVDGEDAGRLEHDIVTNFTDLATAEKADDPMHLFFIGLAYLNGIEVEINARRAADLITRAAERDYQPALEKLAQMYRIGEGVVRDPERALELYGRRIALIAGQGDGMKLYEARRDALELLLEAGRGFRREHAQCLMDQTKDILELAAGLALGDMEKFKLFSLLALVNQHDEQVCDPLVERALRLLPDACGDDDQALAEAAFLYSSLAGLYYERSAGMIAYHFSSDPAHGRRRNEGRAYIGKAIGLLQLLCERDPIRWKANCADALAIQCGMHFAEPFERESEIVDALERAIQMYRELCEDSAALYAPRLAALCRDAGDYMACDIDVDWEAAFGIRLDLALEQCVDGPEQRIPMGWAFGDAPEEFDFRRVRKALCLMRYSAAVYEGYAAKGQNDCWLETAHTLHCLSRLLTCLHGWIGETDDADMRNTRAGLLADSCEGYRRMLDALRRHCDYTRARHSGLPQRTADSRPKAGEGGGTPERELAALERRAYEQDPLADCYNFALKLGSEGLEREAARLQEELRLFLKECFPEADPELVLLNLYACACDRKDCGEALALLLEFDESKAPENAIGRDTLFDYHCMIARCCAEKRDYAAADAHFERANAAMRPMRAWERACFDERWAMCRQDLGDLTGAMDRLWNAMEDLLELKELPVKAWNRMCREYAALLERAGREPEAEAWLKGMLAEQ